MAAIDVLRASDTFLFGPITYHVQWELTGFDGRGPSFCKMLTGPLALTLTSTDLNLPIPNLSIDVQGEYDAKTGLVTWNRSLPISVDLFGTHYNHLDLNLVTRIDEVPARPSADCSGNARVSRVALTTTGNDNSLTLRADGALPNVEVTKIATSVRAGEKVPPVDFDVTILAGSSSETRCGLSYQPEGATVRFTAVVQHLAAVGTYTDTRYSWSPPLDPSVVVIGSPHAQTITIKFNKAGAFTLGVHVVVSTDIEAGSRLGSTVVDVMSPDEAKLANGWCHIEEMMPSIDLVFGGGEGGRLGPVRFVNPLGGDGPLAWLEGGRVLQGRYSLHDLHRMRATLHRVASAAAALDKLATRVIEHRESELKAGVDAARLRG